MTPFTLLASSLSSQVMVAASCSAVATAGIVVCMIGPRTPAACSDLKGASMLVATAPGATALARIPLPLCR